MKIIMEALVGHKIISNETNCMVPIGEKFPLNSMEAAIDYENRGVARIVSTGLPVIETQPFPAIETPPQDEPTEFKKVTTKKTIKKKLFKRKSIKKPKKKAGGK